MQTFEIGDTLVDIPDFLITRDDEGTLVAYPPDTDFANLRFSLISIKTKDGCLSPGAGERLIRKRAYKAGAILRKDESKIWYYETEQSSEGSPNSVMHYWFVAMDAYMLVVSCFVDAAETGNPMTKRVWDAVLPTIKSFRLLDNTEQSAGADEDVSAAQP